MELKTYRAATIQEALAMVRRELGPGAAVLHTRDVSRGLWGWLSGRRRIEVTASLGVNVPSRLPPREPAGAARPTAARGTIARAPQHETSPFHEEVKGQLSDLQTMIEELCRRTHEGGHPDLPETLFHLYTDLIEAEVNEDLARELVDRVRRDAASEELGDPMLVKARIGRLIEEQIRVSGPVHVSPGRRHVVALVGPTGVGKTTTIAKLAAHFRLREKRHVGLITLDTYRIAAVEQLRTYADIIDLPMEIVSTPREMRAAVDKMAGFDLVLIDTAGRSPKDEVKIQELRACLAEASADEVHLVLSSVSSAATLERTAERFTAVGTTSLLLTKLDEATSYGSLLQLVRSCKLPLSYLTDGQNVPDDIEVADPARLARTILGLKGPGVW